MEKSKIVFLLTSLLTAKFLLFEAKGQASGRWSGTVSEHSIVTGQPNIQAESMVTITYNNNIGTGAYTKIDVLTIDEKVVGRTSCSGSGTVRFAELSIDNADSTYTIQTSVLFYTCTYLNGGSNSDSGEAYITIAYEPWDGNDKLLKGSKMEVTDVAGGKLKTTTTWNLVKDSDVELIVTPQDYDNWLPIPGADESTPGPKMMSVTLELKDKKNHQPASEKAKEFRLRLSNTSKERGITINMPLSPAAQQLPDLRFQPQTGAVITEEGQVMTIYCPAGCLTANFKIASYDGGGWTTLAAVAVLQTDSIKGELLEPGGDENILIPKRKPGSKIATAWFTQNGDPADTFDEETSPGNSNPGDGLSAYEEYRGVMHLRQYKRLSAKKKELGILPKESEIGIFSDGFTRFQYASGIIIILFDKSEIPENRRLNQNSSYAQIFKQFVLRINKGDTDQIDITGQNNRAWGLAYGGPDIPARVTRIVIDVDRIEDYYRRYFRINPNLPFTGGELVANTTAHEIGHGVNLPHHGIALPYLPGLTVPRDTVPLIRIFLERGIPEVTSRPYTIHDPVGSPNNHESGNVFCFMCYHNKTNWVRRIASNNELHYFKVPLLRTGTLFCTDKNGTDINANNQYYGNAIQGSCLSRIKLKD